GAASRGRRTGCTGRESSALSVPSRRAGSPSCSLARISSRCCCRRAPTESLISFAFVYSTCVAAVMMDVHGPGLIHDNSVQRFLATVVVLCWTLEGCRAQTTDVTRLGSVDCTTLAGWPTA